MTDTATSDTDTATVFTAAAAPLGAVLDAALPERWAAPSPCAGWSARDVVAHLVGTERDVLTGHGAVLGPAPDTSADPAGAWRDHARAVTAALRDQDLVATAFEGFFGPSTVGATFERFHVWDVLVHRWDVARAVGVDAALTAAELDRIEEGARGFGDALHADGICAPALEVPDGADRLVRVLALLGRAG